MREAVLGAVCIAAVVAGVAGAALDVFIPGVQRRFGRTVPPATASAWIAQARQIRIALGG